MRGWICCLLLAALPAIAGRPLTTEDASVLEDKRCQLEAWLDRGHDATQAWLAPACNFGAGIEWQAGGARLRSEGSTRFSEAYLQAKTLFPAATASPWRAGIVIGVAKRPLNERHRGFHHPYVTIPVSFEIGEAMIHANGGWSRDREAGRNLATWGLAGEALLSESLTVVAEAFGQDRERPLLRAGVRLSVVKEILDLDLTVVTRPGGTRDERFVSLGVFWQSGRFLP